MVKSSGPFGERVQVALGGTGHVSETVDVGNKFGSSNATGETPHSICDSYLQLPSPPCQF